MPGEKQALGDVLVSRGLITTEQLQTALNAQRHTGAMLGSVLLEMGYLDEDQLLETISAQLSIPFIDLKTYKLRAETVRLIPESVARGYRAIVLDDSEFTALVGMADPTDIFAYDKLSRLLKRPIRLAVVRERDLTQVIDDVYLRHGEITSLAEEIEEQLTRTGYDLDEIIRSEEVSDAPVVRLLQTVFEQAVALGASDIHIEPEKELLRIRLRVDGVLTEQVMNEKRVAAALVSRLKVMSRLNIAEKRLPQDGRFNIRIKNHDIDVRVATMPVQYGEALVMRLLDQSGGILDLPELGMPDELLPRFHRAVHSPHGLVLVTGPTGSGKTTTLYAALNALSSPKLKIITVEDPVEYRLPRINQVQVNPQIGLTFSSVLRTALRHDPDILLVGEVRDRETAEIAVRAAITGHLVLSTLHTNDALSTAIRLLDMGVPGYMIAASLQAIVSQRLVRRICPHCKSEYEPSAQERSWLGGFNSDASDKTFWHGKGCRHCRETGYRGRVGVFELLELNGAMADALRREDIVALTSAVEGDRTFRSLTDYALDLAISGATTLAEVIGLAGEGTEMGAADATVGTTPGTT